MFLSFLFFFGSSKKEHVTLSVLLPLHCENRTSAGISLRFQNVFYAI